MSQPRAGGETAPLTIVSSTAHALIVVKPAGLPCELPYDDGADSVIRRLSATGETDLRLVHRLDAGACGLLVVARTAAAAAHYSSEIAERRWHKWYIARVAASGRQAEGLVGAHKAYLKTEGRQARIVRAGGKPSFLDVVSVAPATGAPGMSDVLIRLHTGRFHQIRAMLAHLGAPLAGDTRYGGPASSGFYLEHVLLAARPFGLERLEGLDRYECWRAPLHPDRPPWHPSLAAALDERAAALASELGIGLSAG